MVVPSPQPGCQRGLFGRLGIRKPSILSLTSPHGHGASQQDAASAATARTFSLDDLLKPPPRRKATAFPCEMPCLWTDFTCLWSCSLTRSTTCLTNIICLSLSLCIYLSLSILPLISLSCIYIVYLYLHTALLPNHPLSFDVVHCLLSYVSFSPVIAPVTSHPVCFVWLVGCTMIVAISHRFSAIVLLEHIVLTTLSVL